MPRCQQLLAPSCSSPRSNGAVLWNRVHEEEGQAHCGWMHLASVNHPHYQQTLSQWPGKHPALGKNTASWVGTEQNHPSQAKLSKAGLSLCWNPDSACRILAGLQLGSALVNVTTISQIAHSLNKTQFGLRLCDVSLKGEKRQERSQCRASYYISAIIKCICLYAFLTE